jgi:hypothetical protein
LEFFVFEGASVGRRHLQLPFFLPDLFFSFQRWSHLIHLFISFSSGHFSFTGYNILFF